MYLIVLMFGKYIHVNIATNFLDGKKAITISCGAIYLDHTAKLLNDKQLLTIFQILELQTALFRFKAFHKTLPHSQQLHFTLYFASRRHENKLKLIYA